MGKKVVRLKSKESKKRQDVASFLRDLAQKLESEELLMQRGVDEVRLKVPGTVALGLESEQKKKKAKIKHSLEIQIEWAEGERSDSAVSFG